MGTASQSGHVYYHSLAELQKRNSHPKVDALEYSAMEPRCELPSSESSIGATSTGMMVWAFLMPCYLSLPRIAKFGIFNSDIFVP